MNTIDAIARLSSLHIANKEFAIARILINTLEELHQQQASEQEQPKQQPHEKPHDEERLLTTAEAAQFANCSTSYINSQARGGLLKSATVSPPGSVRAYRKFRKEDLQTWLNEQPRLSITSKNPNHD